MMVDIRDRIRAMIDAGMSLRQVQAADPTASYSGFGRDSGFWTTERFIEAIYLDLLEE